MVAIKIKSGLGWKPKRTPADFKARESKRQQRAHKNKESAGGGGSRLNATLLYAKAGLPVVPLHGKTMGGGCTCRNEHCKRPGNHPRTANGLQDATTDTGKIKKMWGRWPNAKVAIALGDGVIGVVVEGKPGREALKKLENAK
jgi:Bifunctional DNA primase/polymerase, N-terminal